MIFQYYTLSYTYLFQTDFRLSNEYYGFLMLPHEVSYVCDDGTWNVYNARVICRQVGYSDVREVLHDAETIFG